MRNISFSMTTQAFIDRRKTVTRRLGWANLKVGEILQAVEKAQGLKKGEHVVKLGAICVISTRIESLWLINQDDVVKEGFQNMSRQDFLDMFCKHNKVDQTALVNRIEFEYL